jgi:DNA polymerase-4
MVPYLATILYIHMPGLLSLASARVSAQEMGLVPIAVGEGKVIRDASPQARHSGVHVGQSVLRARRLCPMLLVVPLEQVDPRPLSHCLYDVLAEFSPTVEPVAPDAAYVVLERREEPLVHRRLAEAFPELSPVLAIGSSKLIARTLAEAGVVDFDLAPSRFLWPEDAAITGKLERLGLTTIGEVAHIGETALRYQFGHKLGNLLYRRVQGLDSDPVLSLWPLPTIDLARRFD